MYSTFESASRLIQLWVASQIVTWICSGFGDFFNHLCGAQGFDKQFSFNITLSFIQSISNIFSVIATQCVYTLTLPLYIVASVFSGRWHSCTTFKLPTYVQGNHRERYGMWISIIVCNIILVISASLFTRHTSTAGQELYHVTADARPNVLILHIAHLWMWWVHLRF